MKLKKYIGLLGISLMTLTTACEDQSELITSIDYDRLFAPINLEARVVNEVNVRFTWTPVTGAESYEIEVYQNATQDSEDVEEDDSKVLSYDGEPVRSVSGILSTEIPYVLTGLEGETKYTARVRAVSATITASTWSGVEFKTNAEQILEPVSEEDLTHNSVTLRWPAGQTATEIVLTPGDIHHAVTSEEIAVGAATVTGLTAETEYTAKLMNNNKTRGTQTFKTLVDLAGAIAIDPEDDFMAILAAASDGDAFAFYPGTYIIPGETEGSAGKLDITASIEIKAVRPNDRPVINGCITLNNGASLTLSQIILDGTGTDGSQAIDYKEAVPYDKLVIDDCEIRNYVKGFYYVNVAATINEITINNCLIHDIECSGGDMFDCRAGYIAALNITNNTIWNSCKARDFVRYDDKSGDFPGAAPVITIDRNTIDGVSNDASRRLLYVRFQGNSITFTNNMVSNMPDCGRGFSDSGNTAVPTFDNNNYFNTKNLVSEGGDGKAKFFDAEGMTYDPGYANAAEGDFTVSHEELLFKQVGDPRWIK